MEATTKTVDQITTEVIAGNVSHAKQPKAKKPDAAALVKSAKAIAEKKTEPKPKAAPKAKAKEKAEQPSLDLTPTAAPSSLVMVPLMMIETREQVRTEFNDDTLMELAGDIAIHGVLQPVLLRPTDGKVSYTLIAGERRVRAAKLAGLDCVPAIVGEVSQDYATDMQIAENIQREDLSLKDLAAAVRKIYDKTGSVTTAALTLKKSKSWVSKHVAASCPNLHHMARDLMESGATEDLEIVLMIDKMQPIDYCGTQDLCRAIKTGNAGRQTVKEALEKAKADKEQREAEWAAQNTPELEAEREETAEKNRAAWEEKKRKQQEERERNPMYVCSLIMGNTEMEPEERTELTSDQREIIIAHLGGLFDEAQQASNTSHVKRIMEMQYNDYNPLEIGAYVAGITQKTFDLNTLIEQTDAAIKESIE